MQLYSFFNSSTSYRVRIALALKGQEVDYHGVNLRAGEQRQAQHRELSPIGGVPVLVGNDGVSLTQSIMMDAIDAHEVGRIEVGERFRQRFGNPYGVIHHADIHLSILEAVQQNPLIRFQTLTHIAGMEMHDHGVTLTDSKGNRYQADAVIGCDGVKSVIRERMVGDPARVTGHVVYRAVVDVQNMPEDLRVNAPMLWAGPRCHLVHYPLRGGQQYNLVVTFHSRHEEQWGVTDGSKEEVLSYFEGIHERPRQMLDRPTSWRRAGRRSGAGAGGEGLRA